jgi:signal transduction histidine kinase
MTAVEPSRWGSAATFVVGCWFVLLVAARIPACARVLGPAAHLDVVAGAIAVVAGVATIFRWRFDGSATSWWIGLALIVIGFPGLASAESGDTQLAIAVGAAVPALILLYGAFRTTAVDSALSTRWAAIALVVSLSGTFAITAVSEARPAAARVSALLISTLLIGLAALWHKAQKHESWLFTPLIGYALAIALWGLIGDAGVRAPAATIMQLLFAGVAAAGALKALHVSATTQRTVAFHAARERDVADMRRNEVEARYAETLHEVRSTVVSIEGGMSYFRPPVDAPNDDLVHALVAELQRLRALVDHENAAENAAFSVNEALEPLFTLSEAVGQPLRWDIPDGIRARGRAADVTQIVHSLLMNARRHAPNSPIDVTARRDGDGIVLHVDDGGPGIAPDDLEWIFERGQRSDAVVDREGAGLGLHIARRLARELGGDLWAENRVGGGARFVLSLRSALDRRPSPSGERVGSG